MSFSKNADCLHFRLECISKKTAWCGWSRKRIYNQTLWKESIGGILPLIVYILCCLHLCTVDR